MRRDGATSQVAVAKSLLQVSMWRDLRSEI